MQLIEVVVAAVTGISFAMRELTIITNFSVQEFLLPFAISFFGLTIGLARKRGAVTQLKPTKIFDEESSAA